jgi:hypothetical protein
MLEIIEQELQAGGSWMHRGRIRGMTHEARDRVHSFLSREQISRLRARGLLRHEEAAKPPGSA